MAKKNCFIIPFARKSSFLIGDSPIDGKDQILSDTLKYNKHGLYDEGNRQVLNKARRMALEGRYHNIRIETVWENAVCIKQGVIGHKESRRTTKPFDLFGKLPTTWTYEAVI